MAEVRAVARDGVTIMASEEFSEVRELEVAPVTIALEVDPWPWPDAFRPLLTVSVQPLTPDAATIQQLSVRAIEVERAQSHHVVACDLWGDSAPDDNRRITSIYASAGTTVLHLQHLAIRNNRAITVSIDHGIGHYGAGQRTFERAVLSLQCTFDDPAVDPDPATMPALDEFAARREPTPLEDLGRACPALVAPPAGGTSLDTDQLDALHRGRVPRGVDTSPLESAGLVKSGSRRLSELGGQVHRVLARPRRRVSVEVRSDDQPRAAGIVFYLANPSSAVLSNLPPGSGGVQSESSHFLEVVPPDVAPVALIQWLGVAPVWTWGLTGDGSDLVVPGSVVSQRLESPDAPPPPGASGVVERMWRSCWRIMSVTSTAPGSTKWTVLMAPGVGYFEVAYQSAAEVAQFRPLPSATFLKGLLRLGGNGLSE